MSIYQKHIFVCTNQRPLGTRKSCGEENGLNLVKEFKKQINDLKLDFPVRAQKCGCLDVCEKGPMVAIYPDAIFYGGVQLSDVQRIVENHLLNGEIITELQVSEK